MVKCWKIIGYGVFAIVVPGGMIIIIAKNREGVMRLLKRLFESKKKTRPLPANCSPLAPWHRMPDHSLILNEKKMSDTPQWAMCS
jgi:hypothetical protein